MRGLDFDTFWYSESFPFLRWLHLSQDESLLSCFNIWKLLLSHPYTFTLNKTKTEICFTLLSSNKEQSTISRLLYFYFLIIKAHVFSLCFPLKKIQSFSHVNTLLIPTFNETWDSASSLSQALVFPERQRLLLLFRCIHQPLFYDGIYIPLYNPIFTEEKKTEKAGHITHYTTLFYNSFVTPPVPSFHSHSIFTRSFQ